jgi:hypothetical protein
MTALFGMGYFWKIHSLWYFIFVQVVAGIYQVKAPHPPVVYWQSTLGLYGHIYVALCVVACFRCCLACLHNTSNP